MFMLSIVEHVEIILYQAFSERGAKSSGSNMTLQRPKPSIALLALSREVVVSQYLSAKSPVVDPAERAECVFRLPYLLDTLSSYLGGT